MVNFAEPFELQSAESAVVATGTLRALSLAAADVTEDGTPDLLGGYELDGSGLVVLYPGNPDSIYPNSPAAQQRRAGGEFTDLPFLSSTTSFHLPHAPDFMASGDFNADGHVDIVTVAYDSNVLQVLDGNGQGQFAGRTIFLAGEATALASGDVNRADGLMDIIVAVRRGAASRLLVFESPKGALEDPPEIVDLPPGISTAALSVANLDADRLKDIVAVQGPRLVVIRGRDRKLTSGSQQRVDAAKIAIERRTLPYNGVALAVGDFVRSERSRDELALLDDAGSLHFLEWSSMDGKWKLRAGEWHRLAEAQTSSNSRSANPRIMRVRVSSLAADDLLVPDAVRGRMLVLTGGPGGTAQPTSIDLGGEPVAVLPMRLNPDALNDLVILRRNDSAPSVAMTVPVHTFVVNSSGTAEDCDLTDDICSAGEIDDETGTCIVTGECSLKGAIQQSNASPGLDEIHFSVSAVAGVGPNAPATDPVVIDGSSLGRVHVTGSVFLNGGDSVVRGLEVAGPLWGVTIAFGGGNLIEGSVIRNNEFAGIQIQTPNNIVGGTNPAARNFIYDNSNGIFLAEAEATGNVVLGNFIGIDENGLQAGNAGAGVLLGGGDLPVGEPSSNVIGGTTVGARNVISGNSVGLRITSSSSNGPTTNMVLGNFIGTNASGVHGVPNSSGVVIEDKAVGNTIGGTSPNARNLISGNSFLAVGIYDVGTTDNSVLGNWIGTDASGTTAIGNSVGVSIASGASSNSVGGAVFGSGNVISGNGSSGVDIFGSSSNLIAGNLIGTDANGLSALGNVVGISVNDSSENNIIGGTAPASGNVISANIIHGISIGTGSEANYVIGNLIGTDATGAKVLGNGDNGIILNSSNNVVGGASADAGNVVSGNLGTGLLILDSTDNTILGNYIGTDVDGTLDLGNGFDGISISLGASDNVIGGPSNFAGNVIAHNDDAGVGVFSGTGNSIRGNSTYANSSLGIDLGSDGVTPNDIPLNDDPDIDTGPNELQNFPVLTSVSDALGGIEINGTLRSTPSTTFTLDFYRNDACDTSGFGEGQEFLGSTSVTINAFGDREHFSVTLPLSTEPSFITATATDPAGNTSEFSRCFDGGTPPPPPPGPSVVINEIDADTSGTDTLEFIELYDGGSGGTDLTGLVMVLFNGDGDITYQSFDLDGFSTDLDGYFVLGNGALSPAADLVFDDDTLQNGPDAVALYEGDAIDFPLGTGVTTADLVDAVVYDTGDVDDAGLLALLNPAQPQVNEAGGANAELDSSQRCPNGAGGERNTDTFTQALPTPSADNACGTDFFTVSPCRLIDTRDADGPLGGPALMAQTVRTFIIVGNCGVPASAKAISVNLAVTQPSVAGNVRLYSGGGAVPTISSINYASGQTRSNNAVVRLGASGQLSAFVGQASGLVHFILDVNGYFE